MLAWILISPCFALSGERTSQVQYKKTCVRSVCDLLLPVRFRCKHMPDFETLLSGNYCWTGHDWRLTACCSGVECLDRNRVDGHAVAMMRTPCCGRPLRHLALGLVIC